MRKLEIKSFVKAFWRKHLTKAFKSKGRKKLLKQSFSDQKWKLSCKALQTFIMNTKLFSIWILAKLNWISTLWFIFQRSILQKSFKFDIFFLKCLNYNRIFSSFFVSFHIYDNHDDWSSTLRTICWISWSKIDNHPIYQATPQTR